MITFKSTENKEHNEEEMTLGKFRILCDEMLALRADFTMTSKINEKRLVPMNGMGKQRMFQMRPTA